MRRFLLIGSAFLALLLSGCSSEKSAASLLETAQFEEKQHNREHAQKIYQEIVSKYPGTKAADTAGARLDELKQRTR